jgi:hypothetical protein
VWDTDRRKQRQRERDRNYFSCRVYRIGRMLGRPRCAGLRGDVAFLVTGAPAALRTPAVRRTWAATVVRRWDRMRGFVRFGIPEVCRSQRSASAPPIR